MHRINVVNVFFYNSDIDPTKLKTFRIFADIYMYIYVLCNFKNFVFLILFRMPYHRSSYSYASLLIVRSTFGPLIKGVTSYQYIISFRLIYLICFESNYNIMRYSVLGSV